jgi:hypothetical protein
MPAASRLAVTVSAGWCRSVLDAAGSCASRAPAHGLTGAIRVARRAIHDYGRSRRYPIYAGIEPQELHFPGIAEAPANSHEFPDAYCAHIAGLGAHPGWCARRAAEPRGLVIRHGDGRVLYRYVEFTEPEITGSDLLIRSGVVLVTNPYPGLGEGVCKLDHEGCPADNCFCKSYQSPSYYWHYYRLNSAGDWTGVQTGPIGRKIHDGDVDGWSWTASESGLADVDRQDNDHRLLGIEYHRGGRGG